MQRKTLWKRLSFYQDGFYDTRLSKLTFPWQNVLFSMVSVLLIQISLSLEIMIYSCHNGIAGADPLSQLQAHRDSRAPLAVIVLYFPSSTFSVSVLTLDRKGRLTPAHLGVF